MTRKENSAKSLAKRSHLRVVRTSQLHPTRLVWLDLTNKTLKRGSLEVKLKPKAFAVLCYLQEHPQRLVTKQELFDAVWADTYVTDGVLKNCISELRHKLQDSATAPQYIETVHRRGYRLLTALRTTDPVTESPAAKEERPQSRVQSLEPTQIQDLKPVLIQVEEPKVYSQEDHPPTPSTRPLAGERRQLTVMFCGLVGSTALSAQLDPEDYHEVIRTYSRICSEVVTRYEGYIAQYHGGGAVVYFGYPIAHDDEARRAAQTGLEIVAAMKDHPTKIVGGDPITLHARVGIHTGPVVIDEIGTGSRAERIALGETINMAVRLQTLADPDTVVMSATTQRLVRGYVVCHDLGLQTLKGLTTPVQIYRGVEARPATSRFDVVLPQGLTPFVGRDGELAFLQQQAREAKAGRGHAVMISGEAGIGKSRLALTLKEQFRQDEGVCVEFRCSPYHQATALYPITEHLQRLLGFQREDAVDAKLEKLQRGLATYRFPQVDTVPLLAALLSLPHPKSMPPLTLNPQRQKQKLTETLVAWLVEEAERTLVYTLWEDLQWADSSTLEVLTLYLDQAPMTRTLAVFTARPEFSPPWGSRSYMSHLPLSTLSRMHSEAMVKTIMGGRAHSSEIVGQIAERSDGNPLFVEELTKTVLETDPDTAGKPTAVTALSIPGTLHDALLARLDRLGTTRVVAQFGAVLGREFTYEMLQAVGVFDDDTLQQTLPKLVETELVYQRGVGAQARYTFKHALIQEAAYQSLLRRTRQQYHHQTVRTLEEYFPDTKETQPELLAHHYTEAGLIEHAIPYWLQAGERAAQRSACVEAVAHLTKGLALLQGLPDTPERVEQELAFQVALGPVLMATKGWAAAEVEHAYARARELCERGGGESSQRFRVLQGVWAFHLLRANLQEARELGEQLLRLAQNEPDPAFLLDAHLALGASLLWLGDFGSSHAHMAQGAALYDRLPRRPQHPMGADPGVICLSNQAEALWYLGYPDQAQQKIRAMLTLAQELAHPFSLSFALDYSVWCHQHRGEVQAVQEQAEDLIALTSEQGFALNLAQGNLFRGWALVMQGEETQGLALMHQGLAAYRATGTRLQRTYFPALLVEGYEKVGQIAEGLRVLAEALAAVDKTGEHHYEAELYRLKGELTLQTEVQSLTARSKAAEVCFHTALDVARQQSAKSWELRAATSLAHLWQRQGKQQEARKVLTPVYNWFTEGFDTADLQDAKALLNELASLAPSNSGGMSN